MKRLALFVLALAGVVLAARAGAQAPVNPTTGQPEVWRGDATLGVPRAPKPRARKAPGLSAREIFVRDSIARAAFLRDSLARDRFVRDSIARAEFVRDSIARAAREALRRDSLARVAFVRDSIARADFVRDSLARAELVRDSLAKVARADSLYGKDGAMPRIEGDPNITRPTVGLGLSYVAKTTQEYFQVQGSYGRPFWNGGSWEIDLPVQAWDSVGGAPKHVNGFANATFTVNKRISSKHAKWRQIATVALSPQSGLVNGSIGNDQWTGTVQYAISRWFASDRLHFRSITYYQYGWWVWPDNGTKQKNVLIPRLVLTDRVTPTWDVTADLRPRIDFTRQQFYTTLMLMASTPIAQVYGMQVGYEFPLSTTAEKRVEKGKVVLNFSRTY